MNAAVIANNLSQCYAAGEQQVVALDRVSLRINQGEMVAIMGPSGSGKSTLMNLLGCLGRPTSGSLTIAGVAVNALDSEALARFRSAQIGFVFQQFNLLARTSALANVMMPLLYSATADDAEGRARRALQRVGLGERLDHRPNQLSGGQQQRVAIARAIINNPSIIFADEPTGALDSRTGEEVMDLFHELNRSGVTIVLVTHDPEVAGNAQRTIQMRDGRVVAEYQP